MPNYNFDEFFAICAGDEKCEIIYNTAHHGQSLSAKNGKYEVVNKINSNGIEIEYSNKFVGETIGVSKVIVNEGWIL